eukprot:6875441-Prymnesium_polylepis.1
MVCGRESTPGARSVFSLSLAAWPWASLGRLGLASPRAGTAEPEVGRWRLGPRLSAGCAGTLRRYDS